MKRPPRTASKQEALLPPGDGLFGAPYCGAVLLGAGAALAVAAMISPGDHRMTGPLLVLVVSLISVAVRPEMVWCRWALVAVTLQLPMLLWMVRPLSIEIGVILVPLIAGWVTIAWAERVHAQRRVARGKK